MRQNQTEMGKRIRISNETLNCYGTWVRTDGVDLSQYERNPVLLWMHERGCVIGMVKDIRRENGEITGEPWFDDVREESRMARQQWEKGTLRMGSPNFDILELSEDPALLKPGQTCPTVTRSKLVEYSMVDIGGNDDNISLIYEGKPLKLSKGDGSHSLPLLKKNNNQKTTPEMNNEEMKAVALMLGLTDAATLTDVQKKINLLLEYQKANGVLQAEKEKLEKELDGLRLSGITALVDSAIGEGKISADRKDHFISLGKLVGAESLKLTFEAMNPALRPSVILAGKSGGPAHAGGYEKWTDVPEEELKLMRSDDPQQYRRLYKKQFGVDCPEFN